MTTTPTTAEQKAPAATRLSGRVRVGQSLLTLVFAACALVSISTMFVDDPFEPAAVLLIASFGSLAAVIGLAAVWGGVRSRIIRVALWALPLFFVWHIAALGTWIPDAVLAIVAASGAVLITGAGQRTR